MFHNLIDLLETRLGFMCGCLCSKCLKKSKRYHCGVKAHGCFRQMQ